MKCECCYVEVFNEMKKENADVMMFVFNEIVWKMLML